MFLEAHKFPRALLFEKSPLLGTDNVCGQISNHILKSNKYYSFVLCEVLQALFFYFFLGL